MRSFIVTYRNHEIPSIWPHVVDHIKRAIDRGSDYTLEQIFDGLITRDFQLWTSQSETIEAALVTAIQDDATGRFCLLLAAGGENMDAWLDFIGVIEEWARDHNCHEMRIYGRRGWAKVLDYDICFTKMRKTL